MNQNEVNTSTISSNKKQSFAESDARPFPKSVFTESESKSSHVKQEIIEISENEFENLNSHEDKVVIIKKSQPLAALTEPEREPMGVRSDEECSPPLKSNISSQQKLLQELTQQPEKKQPKSSPLLLKQEKDDAIAFGYSFDSKKVTDTIENVDMDIICKCFAYALLKHIEFSKGELLIDDLVSEEQDIP